MAIELVGKTLNAPRQLAPDSIIRSTESIRGTEVLRGSDPAETVLSGAILSGTPTRQLVGPSATPEESIGAFRGVAWSLTFEAAVAGLGFALWQIWKVLR